MKSFGIALLALTVSILAFTQSAKSSSVIKGASDVESIIMGFLREVYETQDDALKIAHQYIELDNSPDSISEFSIDKRYEIAAAHITLLREGKGVSSFSPPLNKQELSMLRIVPYTSLAVTAYNKLLDFGTSISESQYVYVVMKNDVIWKYFYVRGGKIYSFDYLLKGEGGRVYFFAY